MKLLIDMGNSRIKWRLRHQSLTLGAGSATYDEEAAWDWLVEISAAHPLAVIWVASVAGVEREKRLLAACAELGLPAPQFAAPRASVAGLECGYRDYRTLGVDRWLALLGARGRGDCVVVDSGTALTVDLLLADGCHLGGYIGPGLSLMRRSLAGESAALAAALRQPLAVCAGPGLDSTGAIDSALLAMGAGLIRSALAQMPSGAQLLLSGGDAPIWEALFEGVQMAPELVFDGLEVCFSQDETGA